MTIARGERRINDVPAQPVHEPQAHVRRGLVAARLADEVIAGGDRHDAALSELRAICRRSGANPKYLLGDAARRAAAHTRAA